MLNENLKNRKFMIFNVSEIPSINFNEVLETSPNTLRLSKNQTKTFVKWESEIIPQSVESLTTKEGPYNYEEIILILSTPEWSFS